ncbi:efflux RND transporter periplasmic adaptor subunit [Metabacillus idriensis]|uniref:efflux RND transporter periplasmic adaptor subunit n=1 Tax=Metabacillus idriensis TaxID=324768 RepID=UPI0028130225|nr:efflux RND transporter periplasmic adaptor subunit [Metabacillus idriensis]MDR0137125.1 efflux RND transporter periplasmic adaptor subunit [Metabacillus idriensis]
MKKKIWISIGVVSIIALLVGVNVYRAMSKEEVTVRTVKLSQQEIASNVMVPGTLKFQNEQYIYPDPENGDIAEILVKEGDAVKEGTPLLRYENQQFSLEKEQNALSIESGYLKINQLENQLDDLKEKDLSKQVGEEEAEKTIDAERDQLKMEQKMADIELRQLLLQKETIEKQLSALEVKSDMAGTVMTIDENPEQAAEQGGIKAVIHIAKTDQFIVSGVLSEYDSLKVEDGQPVTLSSDVVPDVKWKGKVSKIGLLPEASPNSIGTENAAVQYPVEVSIEGSEMKAKPGFKLIMEIETEKRIVQTVPVDAVKQDGEDYFVYTITDGKTKKKTIEIGTASSDYMEVKEGLTADDAIVSKPNDDLQSGTEVTVK